MTRRKIILGTVIAAVALVLASPYILGILTERVLRDFVQSSNSAGDGSLEIVGYERGWLGSQMSLAISYPEDDQSSIVFEHEIHHGPLLPPSACGGRFGLALSRGYSSLQPITPVIEHFLPGGRMSQDCFFLGYTGNIHGVQEVAGFEGTDFAPSANPERAATQVAWAPISAEWTYLDETRPKLRGSLKAPRFTLDDGTTRVQVDVLDMSMDLQRAILPALWDGEVKLAVENLQTSEAQTQAPVSIGGLEMSMKAQTGTEKAALEVALRYDTVSASERNFGEGRWSLRFENFGTRGIQAFNERRESLLAAGVPQDSALYVQAFRDFMPDMLATDPRLVLDFSQDLDGEPISAKGYARITDPKVVASNDPRQWLRALEVDLNLSMPQWFLHDSIVQYQRRALEESGATDTLDEETAKQLLDAQATAMLAQLEKIGYVQKRDDLYRMRFYLRDGNATVNDQHLGNYVDMLFGNDTP